MTVQESVLRFRDCKTVEELSAAVIAAKAEANKIEDQGVRFSTHEQIDFVAKQEVSRLIPVLGIGAWPIEKVKADIQKSPSSEPQGKYTGQLVFELLSPKGLTNPVGYQACTDEEKSELERLARAINRTRIELIGPSEPVSIGPGVPDPPPPPPPTKALPSQEQRRKDFDAWWATLEVPQAWKKQGPAFVLQAWEKAVELYAWGPDRLALLNLKKALREVVRDYTDTLSKGPTPISVETAMAFVQGIHIDFEKRLEALT